MVEKVTIFSAWGETATLESIDARRTLQRHPDEWRKQPFPESEHAKGLKAKVEREARERAVIASQQAAVAAPVQIDPRVLDAAVKAGVEEELRRREKEAADASNPAAKHAADEEAAWRADLTKAGVTAEQLQQIANDENIPVEPTDSKKALVEKIVAGRKTAAAQS